MILTDSERRSAWRGYKPLPRRYRWPASAYHMVDKWLFRYDDKGESSRKILGRSQPPQLLYRIANLADLRGRRWCYKHQAHSNSFSVNINRWGASDGNPEYLQERLDAARVRVGEKAWHKMEYKRMKRLEKYKRIAKRGEKRYG